mmetsp:Transcript_20617/g.59723  ORF Transcript_20617/g.59723 Transcript_20617/m.59723 type:complete len:507 (+) Transcript_20617:135-1655(+)
MSLLQVVDGCCMRLPRSALVRQLPVQLIQLCMRRCNLLGVSLGRLANDLLALLDPLVEASMAGVLGLHIVRQLRVHRLLRLQGLHMPLMLLHGVAEHLLDVAKALLHGGMAHLSGLLFLREVVMDSPMLRLRLRGELGVGVLQQLELLGVFARRVAKDRLEAVHAVLVGCMQRLVFSLVVVVLLLQVRNSSAVPLTSDQPRMQVVHLCLGLLKRSRVLVSGVAHHRLQIADTLLERRMRGLQHSFLRRQAGVRSLQLGERGPCALEGGHAAVNLVDLGVGRCDVLHVRTCGVPELLLQVVQPLLHRGMLRLSCADALHLLRVPRMDDLQIVQLFRMLVRRVAEELFQVVDALLQRRMVRVERRLLLREGRVALLQRVDRDVQALASSDAPVDVLEPRMRILQGLAVLVSRIADAGFDGLDPVPHRRMVHLQHGLVRRQCGMRLLELADRGRDRLNGREPPMQLVAFAVRAAIVRVVPVVHVRDDALQRAQTLHHGDVLGVHGLHGL